MTNRKQAITKALQLQTEALLDVHLAATKVKIPPCFRNLQAKVDSESKESTPEPESKEKDLQSTGKESSDTQSTGTTDEAPEDSTKADPPLSEPPQEGQEGVENKVDEQGPTVSLAEINAAYNELMKYADHNDSTVLLITAKHAVAHERYGIALRCVNKIISEGKSTQELQKALFELADTLGFGHVAQQLKNEYIVKYCINDRPF
ncbi:unnamed protein product [Bursaphelenchus okinawaensis]|uniref:Uncharacterized protein n=1 Tax=Bursaphelenchus okinawaensis TaxID=465554 RepID=A0A811LJD5_9BILA|nr:unnamed protein product [Bursaphelenchus okinawaensis]CAG9123408.1 unnamed protein product [Bursaphelenchus okinawaensis]